MESEPGQLLFVYMYTFFCILAHFSKCSQLTLYTYVSSLPFPSPNKRIKDCQEWETRSRAWNSPGKGRRLTSKRADVWSFPYILYYRITSDDEVHQL